METHSHSQTLPRGAVWSRFRCKLKSRPARSCRKWVLSMISALSGSRKRWSLPSAGPRVRGTPSPRGPERAVNILPLRFSKNALSPDGASSDPIPDTLTVEASLLVVDRGLPPLILSLRFKFATVDGPASCDRTSSHSRSDSTTSLASYSLFHRFVDRAASISRATYSTNRDRKFSNGRKRPRDVYHGRGRKDSLKTRILEARRARGALAFIRPSHSRRSSLSSRAGARVGFAFQLIRL